MIQKTHIFLCTLLFTMVFITLTVSGQAPQAPQAEPSAETTFYVL